MAGAPDIGVRIKASGSDEVRQQFRLMASDAQESFARVDRSASFTTGRLNGAVAQSAGAVGTISSSVNGLLGLLANAGDGIARVFSFGLSKAVESSGQLAAASGIAGLGLLGLVGAARSYTQSVAETVSSTSELADTLGLPIEQMSKLQAAFRVEGGDDAKIGAGFTGLKNKIVQLAEGNQGAIDSFSELGLSMQNFRDGKGNLIGTRQQLDLVLDRIERIKNPTTQAKAVLDTFGQSASALGSLATSGAKGLREAEADIEKYGTVVDEATKDTFDEALTAQSKLTESLRGLGVSLTRVFFPFFAESSQGLSDWLNGNRGKIEGFLERIKGVAEKVKEDLVGAFQFVFGSEPAKSGGRRSGNRASTDDDANAPSPRSMGAKAPEEVDEDAPAARSRGSVAMDPSGAARSIYDPRYGKPERRAEISATKAGGSIDIETESAFKLPSAVQAATEEAGRFAEINGRRVRLAVRETTEQLGGLAGRAYNFPVLAVLANGARVAAGAVSRLASALTSKAFEGFATVVGKVGAVAAEGGRAVVAVTGYVVSGVSGVVGKVPTVTQALTTVATAFRDLRLGLERGFVTPWARDIRKAADDVFAIMRGLAPVVSGAFSIVQGALAGAASVVSGFTGAIRRIPEAFGALGPSIEGGLGVSGGAMSRFLLQARGFADAFGQVLARLSPLGIFAIATIAFLVLGNLTRSIGLLLATFVLGNATNMLAALRVFGIVTDGIKQKVAEGAKVEGASFVPDAFRRDVEGRFGGVVDGMRGAAETGRGVLVGFGDTVGAILRGILQTFVSQNPATIAMRFLSASLLAFGFATGSGVAKIVGLAVGGLAGAFEGLVGQRQRAVDRMRQPVSMVTSASFVSEDLRGQVEGRLNGAVDGIRSAAERGSGLVSGFGRTIASVFSGALGFLAQQNPAVLALRLVGSTLLLVAYQTRSLAFGIIGGVITFIAGGIAGIAKRRDDAAAQLQAGDGLRKPASFVVDGIDEQLNGRLGGALDASKRRLGGFVDGMRGLFERLLDYATRTGSAFPAIISIIGFGTNSTFLKVAGALTGAVALFLQLQRQAGEARQAVGNGPQAQPASMIQKAAFPVLAAAVPVAFPLLGWFARGMALLGAELAPALAILTRFGGAIGGIFVRAGAAIGNALGVKGVGAQGVIAGSIAMGISIAYSTGVMAVAQATALLVATSFAALFYVIGIGTFAFTLLSQTVILTIRALGLAVFLMSALGTVAGGVFAAVRAGFLAFRTFMIATAGLTALQFALTMGGIVVIAALAFAAILYFFPEVRKAFFGLCSALMSGFSLAVDALRATWGFFLDVFSDEDGAMTGWFRAMGMLGREFWDDFLNLGIRTWNYLKSFFGLPQTALINRAQEEYDRQIKERLGKSKEEYGGVRERQVEARQRRRANGLLTPEEAAKADPLTVEDLAKRRAARAAMQRAANAGLSPDEQVAAANAELKKTQEAEAKAKAEKDEGGFDGFLSGSFKGLKDRFAGTSKDADGKEVGTIGRIVGALGLGDLGGMGKPSAGGAGGGILDGLMGALQGAAAGKAATPAEIKAFAGKLRGNGVSEAEILRQATEKYGNDGLKPQVSAGLAGLMGGLSSEPKAATPDEIKAFAKDLRGKGTSEAEILRQATEKYGNDGLKPQAAAGGIGGLLKGLTDVLGGAGGLQTPEVPDFAAKMKGLFGPAAAEGDEDGAAKAKELRANLDVEKLMASLQGLGGGLQGRSEFSDGVPDPIILDAKERAAAAERRAKAEGGGQAGTSDLQKLALVIEPGTMVGSKNTVDDWMKRLDEIGIRSRSEPLRTT